MIKISPCSFTLAATLVGCISPMANSNAATWVVDDGVTEITPVYVMTHTHGQSFTFVRANFWFWDAKKSVRLQQGAHISVNGIAAKGEPSKAGYTYTANVPVTQGKLTFKLVRGPNQIMEHGFELPPLEIEELPKSYRPSNPVRVPLKYVPLAVGETKFGMTIFAPQLELAFKGQIGNDSIEFQPILNLAVPVGNFAADIYRQQRAPLRDISSASKVGWGVATSVRNFRIEVLEATSK